MAEKTLEDFLKKSMFIPGIAVEEVFKEEIYENQDIEKKTIEEFPEDEYECTLSDELQKIALEELREEPNLRQQAIESMRHFIERHPHIIRCRMDSKYLLRFLRAKKFSIPTAQKSLDKFLCVRNRFPEMLQNLNPENNPVLAEMVDCGMLTPMPGKDKLGRTVILAQIRAVNPKKHIVNEIIRLWVITAEILLEEEYNQINGFSILFWGDDSTLAHAGMWTIPWIKKFVLLWEKSMPLRTKAFNLYNGPSYIVTIFEIFKSLVSKKLSERVHFFSHQAELMDDFPKNALPKEMGGEKPMKEIIDDWKATIKSKSEMLMLLDKAFKVNEKLRPIDQEDPYNLDDGVVGAFRPLEID